MTKSSISLTVGPRATALYLCHLNFYVDGLPTCAPLHSACRGCSLQSSSTLFPCQYNLLSTACWVQIRAGTGGDEAALFCADLLRMYQRYADEQSWKLSFLSESVSENGGLKEAIVQVGMRLNEMCCDPPGRARLQSASEAYSATSSAGYEVQHIRG